MALGGASALPSYSASFISLCNFLSVFILQILKDQGVILYMFGKYVTAKTVVFIQGVKYIFFPIVIPSQELLFQPVALKQHSSMWGPLLFSLMVSSILREGLAGQCLSLLAVIAKPCRLWIYTERFMASRSGCWQPEAGVWGLSVKRPLSWVSGAASLLFIWTSFCAQLGPTSSSHKDSDQTGWRPTQMILFYLPSLPPEGPFSKGSHVLMS